jgi:hypothetical protein
VTGTICKTANCCEFVIIIKTILNQKALRQRKFFSNHREEKNSRRETE